jgi:hypothetical protein
MHDKLPETGPAKPDANAVESRPDAAPDPDPVDEQRGCAAPGRQATLDELITVDEIGTVDLGLVDLDRASRIVGFSKLVNGKHGVRRVCAEIVLAVDLQHHLERAGRLELDIRRLDFDLYPAGEQFVPGLDVGAL